MKEPVNAGKFLFTLSKRSPASSRRYMSKWNRGRPAPWYSLTMVKVGGSNNRTIRYFTTNEKTCKRRKISFYTLDLIQQADLVLLGLCSTATLYGIVLVFSATRYLDPSKGAATAKHGTYYFRPFSSEVIIGQ